MRLEDKFTCAVAGYVINSAPLMLRRLRPYTLAYVSAQSLSLFGFKNTGQETQNPWLGVVFHSVFEAENRWFKLLAASALLKSLSASQFGYRLTVKASKNGLDWGTFSSVDANSGFGNSPCRAQLDPGTSRVQRTVINCRKIIHRASCRVVVLHT